MKKITKKYIILIYVFIEKNWKYKFSQKKELIGEGGVISRSTYSQKTYSEKTANSLLEPWGLTYKTFKADKK